VTKFKKLVAISTVVSIAHFVEDLALVTIGRYTEVHLWIIAIGVISFSLFLGVISMHPRIKRFLGE
jgi:hypothetical protein|tara:strand:- start:830 stop:1027 length:198 start_codon:yes stop_codon:yes gene_type:complete